ncbi:histidine-type phosphatase [Dyella sp. ASV21]|uniref:histidine-type phosphatase n=1 Tax=Dyella sp. ASV21 TaxID=2795114 RepID=UPI0018ED27B4|nr:histidine-type phosphatase [Dyella sp. ASV21]
MARASMLFCRVLLGVAATLGGHAAATATTPDDGELRVRIVLMRHGVRSPTSAPSELSVYSREPWPTWPVAPGVLTEHGSEGLRALGLRYRQLLMADALWQGDCATLDRNVRVIADSTPRNRASGEALVRGLAPACNGRFQALPADTNNPLFHFGAKDEGKDDSGSMAPPRDWPPPAFDALQQVLLGCQDEACLTQAMARGRRPLLDPAKAGDPSARAKALKTAGSLSENLMLGYAQGFALSHVAWGRADGALIGQLITLHNLQFALAKKSMPAAAQMGSNLLSHMLATLQQAAGEKPVATPLAPASTRTVFLLGHDTNLANIGGLLDADWHDARQPDDYPPGGALVLDLRRTHGVDMVSLSSAMPTLEALRQANFTRDDALVRRSMPLPPCPGETSCPLEKVEHWLSTRIDGTSVDADIPEMPWVQ